MKIILASASPRRKELLTQIGFEFDIVVSQVEEIITETKPGKVVEELSRQKAEAVFHEIESNHRKTHQDIMVIGADTVVACEEEILGKPKNKKDAERMLRKLQGRSHQVFTGVTVICQKNGQIQSKTFHEATNVNFYPMTDHEIMEYINSGDSVNPESCMDTGDEKNLSKQPATGEKYCLPEWADKAGGYAIQGICAKYIRGIEGDYNNVVGLPVGRLYQEIKTFFDDFKTD